MKKIFVICSSMVLFAMGAKAQITYGVKTGFNVSSISNGDGAKSLSGFHAGGLVNYAVSEKFALQGEVLYSGQGFRYKLLDFGLVSVNENIHLDYINIPVLAQYYFVPSFYVEAGPQLGILASAKDSEYDPADNDNRSVKSNFKSTDFSAGIGAGYVFKKINLGIGARYTFGLSDITKNFDGVEKITNHNKVFQLGVFYKFGKKK